MVAVMVMMTILGIHQAGTRTNYFSFVFRYLSRNQIWQIILSFSFVANIRPNPLSSLSPYSPRALIDGSGFCQGELVRAGSLLMYSSIPYGKGQFGFTYSSCVISEFVMMCDTV
jgi:hypothetical protein